MYHAVHRLTNFQGKRSENPRKNEKGNSQKKIGNRRKPKSAIPIRKEWGKSKIDPEWAPEIKRKHRQCMPNRRQQNPRGRRKAPPPWGAAEGGALLSSIWSGFPMFWHDFRSPFLVGFDFPIMFCGISQLFFLFTFFFLGFSPSFFWAFPPSSGVPL